MHRKYSFTSIVLSCNKKGELTKLKGYIMKKKQLSEMTLEELWELFPIKLTKHQEEWATWYEEEAQILEDFLPMEFVTRINHIGSTCIATIWAKPTVDILIEIDPLCKLETIKALLETKGYGCMCENESRISMNKGYTQEGFAERVFHLHLSYDGDHDELYFRDYLLDHVEIAKEYEAMKLELWKQFEHNRDAYTEAKTEFIKRCTEVAKLLYQDRYEGITIREDVPLYLKELKQWICEAKDEKLEDMKGFFSTRIDGYEEHMSYWKNAYRYITSLLPIESKSVLDLGCGTGLELDEILQKRSEISVIGIDLNQDMLDKLKEKHPTVTTICSNYVSFDYQTIEYDTILSFETLHHLKPKEKQELFSKIYQNLAPGGTYIEADYLACCEEEEELLLQTYEEQCQKNAIPKGQLVHFDIPLTPEHEMTLLTNAGFQQVRMVRCINGASFLTAKKLNLSQT